MTQANILPLSGRTRANWIRLRTMILLRWVAIIGQLVAITVAQAMFGLQLALSLCYFAVGVSIIGNLIATFIFPENKRLSERENLGMIMFDLLQIAFLLYLTGGLNNPFALLLLGPVTISATTLSLRSTVLLCTAAIVLVSVLALSHVPLVNSEGEILRIPALFNFGQWTALVIAIIFTSAYSRRVTTEVHSMGDALAATQMALAREQKLTDLGGVVAAAAHELGTPLATIKLASAELLNDLRDQPELAEDAALIVIRQIAAGTSCATWGAPERTICICDRPPLRLSWPKPQNRMLAGASASNANMHPVIQGQRTSPRSCANPRSFTPAQPDPERGGFCPQHGLD